MTNEKSDAERIAKIKAEIQKLQFETHDILDKYLGEDEGQWHKVGYWDCKNSPVGVCVYHFMNDRASDRCIYCGEPHERK